ATCDLASKWNWNHTLCAAHCIARRYRGGYCNSKAVCVCRN
nr:Chain A, defensin, mutant DEF-DAA [Anopheles gambiae]